MDLLLLTLRGRHGLIIFENILPRRTFGSKRKAG
jgi:hypothetical protein